MTNNLVQLAIKIATHSPELADELLCIASEIDKISRKRRKPRNDVGTRRGPQRTRWRRRPTNDRRKRKRWLRSPAGRKYQKHRKRVENRPSTKRYRKKMRNHGLHRKYPWLHG